MTLQGSSPQKNHQKVSMHGLLQQYERQVDVLTRYIEATQTSGDMEDIHQLRVAIKNIRASLSLFECCSHGGFKKRHHVTLLAPVYKRAGKIREAQVNLLMLKGYPETKAFRQFLQKRVDKQSQILIAELAAFYQPELVELNKTLTAKVADLPERQVSLLTLQFLQDNWNQTNQLLQGERSIEDLHAVRRLLKEIREIVTLLLDTGVSHFNEEVVNEVNNRLNNKLSGQGMIDVMPKLNSLKKKLKPLHGVIGDWHDREVLQADVLKYLATHKDKTLKQFIANYRRKTNKLRNKVWGDVQSLFGD
ncbi:CHAD domain-containing protein [Paraneptunicella aestuarii]|uniref:CHAD domain-containing protein n=1 Tax=Paraneptunicella aestuarii TaxID=2831148 RepID=UPI001E45E20C|nr:CHAD domain-containing protein [Paraneptunicella aestuarii]UAA40382.1 CHAD domain-containing protein [Paraneptunicella aestuarii]